MANLILGIIDNYTFSDVRSFLFSLQKFRAEDHICLYAGPGISVSTTTEIRKLDVEVIRYGKQFPFIGAPHPANFNTLPEPIHIYNFRHFLYYDYLLKHGQNFTNVLLTDVKDVYFQKNPFSFPIEDKIYVAVENTTIPIEGCACTSKWIRRGYGASVLQQMSKQEVICAGTTLAPSALMTNYLHVLIKEFYGVKNVFNCADQAMHNVLIHKNLVGPIYKSYNFKGPILTIGTEKKYSLDDQMNLINESGGIIPIVHQYDRHPALLQLVKSRYAPKPIYIQVLSRMRHLLFKK